MNDRGLIVQLATFVAILLVAGFILSELYFSGQPGPALTVGNGGAGSDRAVKQDGAQDQVSFKDIRGGGSVVRQQPGQMFRQSAPVRSAATSSPFGTSRGATSTPFQRSQSAQSTGIAVPQARAAPPSGVTNRRSNTGNVAAPSLPSSRTATPQKASSSSSAPENQIANASDTPENEFPDNFSDIAISGHIVDTAGNVIKNLGLSLQLTQASDEAKTRFGKTTLKTSTDEKGGYRFANLVQGSYRVCTVNARGYKAVCQNPRAPHSSADFTLRGTLNGRIYGVVKDAQGAPLSGVSVSATPGQSTRAETDEKGRYSLAMAVSDNLNYQAYFSKKDFQSERVVIKGAAVLAGKKINPKMKKTRLGGFDVSGTVYDQSGSPVSGQVVSLFSSSNKSRQALRASSNSNGEFTIKYVKAANDYRLTVSTNGGYTFDASPYKKMEIYEGMTPLQLSLKSGGKGSFRARVVQQTGAPLSGEMFTLYSGSAYAGRSSSDSGGEIVFEDVPVQEGGSKLRITSTSSPRYTFSGFSLAMGEHLSGLELKVDRGDYDLLVKVVDEAKQPLQGARGVLSWSDRRNGISSQTTRSRGKTSIAGSGEISFSELGGGAHRLQISLPGYKTFSQEVDINQRGQALEVVLIK